MRHILVKFLASLVASLISVAALAVTPIDIKFTSYTPTLRELITSDFKKKPVELSAKLYLPPGNGPFPALVWVSGTGGTDAYYRSGWIAILEKLTVEQGIALLVTDNYSGRNIAGNDATLGTANLPMAARLIDTFTAANALVKDERINREKVFVTGHSAGGLVSINSASTRVINAVKELGVTFAGHIPISPECLSRPSDLQYDGTPMLIISGEKDEQTPVKHCKQLISEMGPNYPVTLKEISGGNHSIMVTNTFKIEFYGYDNCGRWIFDAKGGYSLPDMGGVTNEAGNVDFQKAVSSCAKKATTLETGSEKIRSEVVTHLANYIDTFILQK